MNHQKATTGTEKPAKHRTPIKAIRAKCLDCSCHSTLEVRECQVRECALFPYRMGKRPTTSNGHQGARQ